LVTPKDCHTGALLGVFDPGVKLYAFEALGNMGEFRDKNDGSQDPKKVLLALATAPIAIVAAAVPMDAALAAAELPTPADAENAAETQLGDNQSVASNLPNTQSIYTVKSGDTLVSIAKQFGISSSELLKINQLSTATLLMPGQKLRLIEHLLQPAVLDRVTAPMSHTVKPGETLGIIAKKYSISLVNILALNNLKERSIIFPGQQLKIRDVNPSTPKFTATATEHQVQDGESLTEIARLRNVSLTALLKANKLTKNSIIFTGQILDIPNPVSDSVKPDYKIGNQIGKPTAICIFHGFHKIRPGETVSKIAAIFGISPQALLSANQLNWNSTIYIGQKLVIPDSHSALNCPKLTPLSDEMQQNAEEIIRIGRELGVSDYGIVIALATAMQESSLRNIGFGDRDSVGLFQQRPSAHWGTKQQIMQTDYAIRAFYGGKNSPTRGVARGLLDISGWQNLPLTEAAQAVQISAHPSAYAKWEPSAWRWLIELDGLEDS
jgi:LysM repeat protein